MFYKSRFTLIELLIVVAAIAIIIAIAIPGLLRARISSQETAAIASLKAVATAQAAFKQTFSCDQDTDGDGEYGVFLEITGIDTTRSGVKMNPAVLVEVFGVTARIGLGIANKSGYNFLMYLPTAAGPAIPESSMYPPPLLPVSANADAQESRFICYSWPAAAGNSGKKAFCVSQLNDVFFTANESITGFRYTATTVIPIASASLDATNPSASNIEAAFTPGIAATDGQIWLNLNQ